MAVGVQPCAFWFVRVTGGCLLIFPACARHWATQTTWRTPGVRHTGTNEPLWNALPAVPEQNTGDHFAPFCRPFLSAPAPTRTNAACGVSGLRRDRDVRVSRSCRGAAVHVPVAGPLPPADITPRRLVALCSRADCCCALCTEHVSPLPTGSVAPGGFAAPDYDLTDQVKAVPSATHSCFLFASRTAELPSNNRQLSSTAVR